MAVQADYTYINRDPDPLVQPITVHWRCNATDDAYVPVPDEDEPIGSVYGSDGIPDLAEFLESQIVRVTEQIMLNWLHNHMGSEWVTEMEGTADGALQAILVPPTGSTPPDRG